MLKEIDIQTLEETILKDKPEKYRELLELYSLLIIGTYHQIASTQPGYRWQPYEGQKTNIQTKMAIDEDLIKIIKKVRPSIIAKGKVIKLKN